MLEMSDDLPLVYKLTKYDGITGNNTNVKLLKTVLTQTVYDQDTDNIELMIADYKKETSISNDVACKIEYTSDEISIASFEKYSASFSDEEGNDVDVDFKWGIVANDFSADNLILNYDNGGIKISTKNNYDLVGKTFDLRVISTDDVVLASLTISITALW